MTDVLVRPGGTGDPGREPAAEPKLSPPAVAGEEPRSWLLAGLLLGAGLVHLVMVPTHLGLSAVDGTGFLLAGWAQVALAVLVVARPRSWLWIATAATSAALLAAWFRSRTVGLPFGSHAGEAEPVAFVDGVTAGLEAAAVVVGVGLFLGVGRAVGFHRGGRALGVIGAVGALALATAAVASPSARGHGAAGHGHVDSATGDAAIGDAATGDHGHGTPVDGSAASGAVDDLGYAELANGQMGSHQHDGSSTKATPAEPSIATADIGPLATQLSLTAPLVEAYPTLADARAAGYRQAGPFSPGLGTHFNPPTYGVFNTDGVMDPADIGNPILIYDGIDDDAQLAGFMYMAYQETEPEGFVGDLDRWHYHTAVCIVITPDGIDTPFGADLTGVTDEMCAAKGGTLMDFSGYMVHVWTVPGYESPEGLFSDLNRKITCPDGTYYRIPISEIGDAKTTCLNL